MLGSESESESERERKSESISVGESISESISVGMGESESVGVGAGMCDAHLFGRQPVVVVAFEGQHPPGVDLEDPLGHVVQEVTVVRHGQHGALVPARQILRARGDGGYFARSYNKGYFVRSYNNGYFVRSCNNGYFVRSYNNGYFASYNNGYFVSYNNGYFARYSSSHWMDQGSRWLVGSSRRSRSGSRAIPQARASRFRQPPESTATGRS